MIHALESILRHPRSVLTVMLVALVAGIIAYRSVPKEANPDIDIPIFYISVAQQGVSPEDAERLLVRPLEKHLRGLDGLKEITAIASEGHAGVIVEFNVDFDKDEALNDIRDKVDQAQAELPADADEPLIIETNFALVPTITVAIAGTAPERTLHRLAQSLQDEIEAVPSVLEAKLRGNREEVLEVVIDMSRLESYAITQDELFNALSANNQLIPAGFLDNGSGRFNVKVPGLLETAKDVYSLPIKQNDEGVVTLGDVAEIHRTFKDATNYTRVNGQPAIALDVVKRLGTNIIENNQAVRDVVAAATRDWPPNVELHYLLDQSSFIHEVLGSLESAILTAILLVMIVVLATLGLRSALLVGLAIPTSFMIGFLLMSVMGMTVNMMVMFGLVLTVGMVVDGAIIIVEYADRKIEEGMERHEAYIRAARLMFWPIASSTATTLAAFLPMLLWPGVTGEFMGYLPITVIIVLTGSFLTAMVFLPVLGGLTAAIAHWASARAATLTAGAAALFVAAFTTTSLAAPLAGFLRPLPPWGATAAALAFGLVLAGIVFVVARALARSMVRYRRQHSHTNAAQHLAADAHFEPEKVPGFTGAYVRFLGGLTGSLTGNVAVIAVMGMVIASIFIGFSERSAGVEFFVDEEPDVATVLVSGRGNLSAREALALVSQVEAELLQLPGIENVVTNAYPNGGGATDQVLGGAQDKPADLIGEINIELIDFAERRPWREIEAELRQRTADLAGIKVEPRRIEGGPPTGKDINLEITAPRYEELLALTRQVREGFEGIPDLIDIEDDTPLPGIEWELSIDREEAGRFNAAISSVGSMIQLVTNGVLIGTYRPDDADDELDIRARLPADQRSLERLDELRLQTSNGQVPIANFVTREAKPKVSSITRKDGLYAMSVKAGVDKSDGATVDEKVGEVQAWLDGQSWPADVRFRFRGADEDQAEAEAFLGKAFAASLFIMAIILITQFNSFWQTFVTLLTIVLAAAGALVGMVVTGQKFSVIMTGTGIVALAGIVVNNAIVLIDTYNRMRRDGLAAQEALLKTAAQRLRPILLTTTTTIAGLVPMATQISFDFFNRVVSIGSITAVWWVQLSTAVISGLAFSTLLTLVLVPVLLSLPENLKALFTPKRASAEPPAAQATQASAQPELPLPRPAEPGRGDEKREDRRPGPVPLPDAAE
ncbi:efflux RND transporter permease subunit [Afifella pfennigii]|uniref:efflux RND transporter permease subunit n=1 Tax=Afifella pfennigii TaxID=209897 RepID=UPI00047CE84C|nr:efflux RND transporter permease subunit [Afifella pfennigii]